MIVTALLALSLSGPLQDKPVLLQRQSKLGEKLAYSVKSRLNLEQRQIGLDTFLPARVDINYDFLAEAVKEKADGIFDFHYTRPTMTIIDGETADHGPTTTTEKSNMDLMLTVTPINEFLELKDLAKKDPKKAKTGGGGGGLLAFGPTLGYRPQGLLDGFIGQFVSEIQRLALFIGSLDNAIDFQPKLDVREVSKGDTWKRTVSYSPQKLESKNGKSVMQRLDYVYTYQGIVDSKGIQVYRVTAELAMNSDLVQYIKDNFEVRGELDFKEMSFNLKAKIDYDLDLKTCHTVQAVANSEGGFKIVVKQYPDNPILEQRLVGTTTLRRKP